MDRSMSRGSGGQLNDYADQLRKQLPPAPEGVLNLYVTWIPWVAIVFGIISLIMLLVVGVILAAISPFLALGGATAVSAGVGAVLALVLGIVESVLGIVGGYMMLKRRLTGWWILAFGIIFGILSSIAGVAIIGLIIDLIIGYIHLQVKPRYS